MVFKRKNIVNDIIDEALNIYSSTGNRWFRLWATPKIFRKINKLATNYSNYRTSGVSKNNGDTDYGVKTFTTMGITFYISIDDTIKDFKLTKIHDKI